MDLYSTLEDAIDAAREHFIEENEVTEDDASVAQFSLQKYVMRDGDISWYAEFFEDESEDGDGYPIASGEAAQAIFDGNFDEVELRQSWPKEQTLYEWEDDEFQYELPLDSEEGEAAAQEWEDDNTDADNRWS